VDERWHAGRLRVLAPDSPEPRLLPLETLIFDDDQVLLDGVALGRPRAGVRAAQQTEACDEHCLGSEGKSDLSPYLRACQPVASRSAGLDRETTGLLLCTSDGDLANAVLRPDHETTKTYWLWLDEAISDDDPRLTRLTEGLLHNGQLLSAKRARVWRAASTRPSSS